MRDRFRLGPTTEGFLVTAVNEASDSVLREIVPMRTPIAKEVGVPPALAQKPY